jgi:hypothetical protein
MTEEPSGPSANLVQRHVNRGKRRPEVFGERLVVEADYRDVLGAALPAAAQSANWATRNAIIARDKGGGTFTATLQQYFCGGAPGVVEDPRVQRRRPGRSRPGRCSGEIGRDLRRARCGGGPDRRDVLPQR